MSQDCYFTLTLFLFNPFIELQLRNFIFKSWSEFLKRAFTEPHLLYILTKLELSYFVEKCQYGSSWEHSVYWLFGPEIEALDLLR